MKTQPHTQITSKRCLWIDVLKGICALLVILVHTKKPEAYAFLFRPFFLTAFFFASGYTSRLKNSFFKREVVRTLEILGIVAAVRIIYTFISKGTFLGLEFVIGAFLSSFYWYPSYPPLIWFVPCICGAKLLFQIVLRITKGRTISVLVSSFVLGTIGTLYCAKIKIFLPWHIHTGFFAQYFMAMGFLFRKHETMLEQHQYKILAVATFFYIITICQGAFSADLALLNVSNWPRYIISAFTGTIMISLTSKIWTQNHMPSSLDLISYIGQNSLFFFAFQNYFINLGNKMMGIIGILNDNKYFASLIVLLISSCCLISLLVLRDSILRFLSQKMRKQVKPII